ncbi:unnamed protein product [Effrenium voratum]|uniref:Kinesin motor domain-containing protein n=1 Tax=Effrenium voratum TaxID=2562239 RepID=A0AA36JKD5_9DINO|nr:unnamed protein product [Effrenium voratum]
MDNAAGRVQVWARVRPPDHGPCNAVDCCESSKIIRVRNDVEAQGESSGEKEFGFDGVFSESTARAQRDVFMQIGLPVLREALRGINGTVLAYGQTGSGKTHSLLHQSAKGEEAGLLPRLVASLFLMVSQDVANVYDIEAAAVQVYNEQVDDLLHPDHQGNNLVVRDGGVVNGLTWIRCMKPDEMLEAFTRARANVVYAETKMNKASSRSHAIFQLRISKRERVFEAKGASKVKKSGSEGMRFQEATNINRSLLAFGHLARFRVWGMMQRWRPDVMRSQLRLWFNAFYPFGGSCASRKSGLNHVLRDARHGRRVTIFRRSPGCKSLL